MLRISLQRFAQHDKKQAGFSRFVSVTRSNASASRRICLLKILNLLADLLQFGLAADDALGDRSVIRFRSERVEFAKNLLRDEFQCAPNGSQVASALPIHPRDRQRM